MSVRPSIAAHEPRGLLGALHSMGQTLTEILQTRGALFAVELREEIERRKRMLALAALGFAFLHTALLLVTLLVAVVFWDTHRVAAIVAMTALYLGCGAVALRLDGKCGGDHDERIVSVLAQSRKCQGSTRARDNATA